MYLLFEKIESFFQCQECGKTAYGFGDCLSKCDDKKLCGKCAEHWACEKAENYDFKGCKKSNPIYQAGIDKMLGIKK